VFEGTIVRQTTNVAVVCCFVSALTIAIIQTLIRELLIVRPASGEIIKYFDINFLKAYND
jgi:hypothetical protein